jgi:hypothetical protein
VIGTPRPSVIEDPAVIKQILAHLTVFIGYEWTSNTGGNNLYRVVVLIFLASHCTDAVEPGP